jgi:hypothetical protein
MVDRRLAARFALELGRMRLLIHWRAPIKLVSASTIGRHGRASQQRIMKRGAAASLPRAQRIARGARALEHSANYAAASAADSALVSALRIIS